MSKVTIYSGLPIDNKSSTEPIPLFAERIAAGFPSPADDFLEDQLDLNEHLIQHPSATFFVRVDGDSMIGAGIHSGDILIVDRAVEAVNRKVVIAILDGELTVKRLHKQKGRLTLMPENDKYKPITIEDDSNFEIWGVVTNVIHPL